MVFPAIRSFMCLHGIRTQAKMGVHRLSLRSLQTGHRTSESRCSTVCDISNVAKGVCAAFAIGGLGILVGAAFYYQRKRSASNWIHDEVFETPFVQDSCKVLFRYRSHWFAQRLFSSEKIFKEIEDFPLNSDDVLVVSFPKSGTTWLQYVVWLVMNGSSASEEKHGNIEHAFPYIEFEYPGLMEIAARRSPRLIKSHLPLKLLPSAVHAGKGKVLYITRNVKDVCVSYFHFHKMLSPMSYQGSFQDFFDMFISGRVSYGPYLDHVAEFWEHREDDNILCIQYEDLHKNPVAVIRQVAKFLNRCLSDEEVLDIVHRTRFRAMKENPFVNYSWWDELGIRKKNEANFMRKGAVGDWRNYFTADMENTIHVTCVEPLQKCGLVLSDSVTSGGSRLGPSPP